MGLGATAAAGTARERILRAAANLYARRGFRGTSLREVAEAAGATKPLVLYHFESKEKLFSVLLREALERFHQEAGEIVSRQTGAQEQLRGLLRVHVRQVREGPELAAFAYDVMSMPGLLPLGFDYRDEGQKAFAFYLRVIEDGQRRGEFRKTDATVVAAAMFGTLRLYTTAVLAGSLERIPESLEDDLFDLLMKGMGARDS